MIETIGGALLIFVGVLLIRGYKNVRWIPAPNENQIEHITLDYRKIALGICCIIGGTILVLNLI